LSDVLGEMPEVRGHLDQADLDDLESPEHYLGMAEEFQDRLLASTEESFADKRGPTKEQSLPFLNANNVRLFYRLEARDGLPVLVLSHSLGCDHEMWAPQMPDLLEHFQVLRYDTRGHGASDVPTGDTTLEELGRDVLALADGLSIVKFS